MTISPFKSSKVSGVDGPKYELENYCANPKCWRAGDHAHHVWRRSDQVRKGGGGFDWIRIDGENGAVVIPNKVRLCFQCHEDVDSHLAWIQWVPEKEELHYLTRATKFDNVWHDQGKLRTLRALSEEGSTGGHQHPDGQSSERCAACGRTKRTREALPPGEKRKRKSWLVSVPDDAENGAEVLETLDEEVAALFGHDEFDGPVANRRYFTIVQAFALVLQHKHEIEPSNPAKEKE